MLIGRRVENESEAMGILDGFDLHRLFDVRVGFHSFEGRLTLDGKSFRFGQLESLTDVDETVRSTQLATFEDRLTVASREKQRRLCRSDEERTWDNPSRSVRWIEADASGIVRVGPRSAGEGRERRSSR